LRRHQHSSRLHERVVALAAAKLQLAGYEISQDPRSVDLLASRTGTEAIIEIKTVTSNTVRTRLRLGAGQLLEYRYRRQLQTGRRPAGILVLSSALSRVSWLPDWIAEYFDEDIHLGLTSLVSSDAFVAHTEGALERLLAS
jgi:hypothetical protein